MAARSDFGAGRTVGTVAVGLGGLVALALALVSASRNVLGRDDLSGLERRVGEIGNNAEVALQVARDHGGELESLRSTVATLRGEMLARTEDRFRETDYTRERKAIDERFRWLERELARLDRECGTQEGTP